MVSKRVYTNEMMAAVQDSVNYFCNYKSCDDLLDLDRYIHELFRCQNIFILKRKFLKWELYMDDFIFLIIKISTDMSIEVYEKNFGKEYGLI